MLVSTINQLYYIIYPKGPILPTTTVQEESCDFLAQYIAGTARLIRPKKFRLVISRWPKKKDILSRVRWGKEII